MTEPAELTFDSWQAALPEDVRALLTEHTSGLTRALQEERTETQRLAAERDRLVSDAERMATAESDLVDLGKRLRKAELKEAVFMGAKAAGCVNPSAAVALVAELGLTLGDSAQIDWGALRANAPELFRVVAHGSADGGAGLNSNPRKDPAQMMAQAIRDAYQRRKGTV